MIPLNTTPLALTRLLETARLGPPTDARADEEVRDWVGYESVHPLTWVPPPALES